MTLNIMKEMVKMKSGAGNCMGTNMQLSEYVNFTNNYFANNACHNAMTLKVKIEGHFKRSLLLNTTLCFSWLNFFVC